MLSKVIRQAGGFSEVVKLVNTSGEGLKLLETGHVIKRDCSEEIRHVFLPKIEPFVEYPPGTRFEILAKTKTKYLQAWKQNKGKHVFMAQRYNSCLVALGEVRTYFTYGKFVDMIHTLPPDEFLGRKYLTCEGCYGRLQDITKMVRPENGYVNSSHFITGSLILTCLNLDGMLSGLSR